ncbi:coxsackievirus and adenovirus receptor homolog [Stigmatopora nigra]
MAMMWCLLWPSILLGVICNIAPGRSVEINLENNHYYAATGSNIQLPCTYTHTVDTQEKMEVLWSIISADREEQPIIWFTGGQLYSNIYKPMVGRVHFSAGDPRNGDATINIKDVRPSDMETYRCFVKNLPGLDKKNMDLTIMEAPSQPLCSLDKNNHNTMVKCKSLHGTPPLNYSWAKTTGNKVLPTQMIVDPINGIWQLDNTERECGTFRCTVQSMVATKHCDLDIDCLTAQDMSASSPLLLTASGISAITITITMLVLVAIIISVILYRRWEKRSMDVSNTVVL